MGFKIAYQTDRAGMFSGTTEADESPMEPGVYLLPAGATLIAPPDEWPADQWPRFNGKQWQLVPKPILPVNENDPVAKLAAFLKDNPDVAALLPST